MFVNITQRSQEERERERRRESIVGSIVER
jgi:hypothetical protein